MIHLKLIVDIINESQKNLQKMCSLEKGWEGLQGCQTNAMEFATLTRKKMTWNAKAKETPKASR